MKWLLSENVRLFSVLKERDIKDVNVYPIFCWNYDNVQVPWISVSRHLRNIFTTTRLCSVKFCFWFGFLRNQFSSQGDFKSLMTLNNVISNPLYRSLSCTMDKSPVNRIRPSIPKFQIYNLDVDYQRVLIHWNPLSVNALPLFLSMERPINILYVSLYVLWILYRLRVLYVGNIKDVG